MVAMNFNALPNHRVAMSMRPTSDGYDDDAAVHAKTLSLLAGRYQRSLRGRDCVCLRVSSSPWKSSVPQFVAPLSRSGCNTIFQVFPS
jgi:hypothetical protein